MPLKTGFYERKVSNKALIELLDYSLTIPDDRRDCGIRGSSLEIDRITLSNIIYELIEFRVDKLMEPSKL